MLNNYELKSIIVKKELTDLEIIQVLNRYIYDNKNIDISISRPVGNYFIIGFAPIIDVELMMKLYDVCCEYYYKKLINGE